MYYYIFVSIYQIMILQLYMINDIYSIAQYMGRYQYLYEEDGSANCVDVNECTAGNHMCSPDAQCINQEGSHMCQCRAGFTGDGRVCESKSVFIYFIKNYLIYLKITVTVLR